MADRPETAQSPNQTSGTDKEQASFDQSFIEQMGGSIGANPSTLGYDLTSQVVTSYFENIEAQTRQARRMADLWAQSLILQQTTSEVARAVAPVVAKQVIEHLRTHPQVLKDLASR